jgi:tRNA modification GTPase
VSGGAALDTIVAPATPVGRSALAIVRIDGPTSLAILESLSGVVPEPRVATLVRLRDIDECIAVRYVAPHSFTGNDLVELTLHGNPLLVERLIEAATQLGARFAQPGEFTERAVLNGKLDLVQAESIADLINARTSLQAKLSLENLEGSLSRTAAAIRESLLVVISRLEAALDFSDEGYEFITRDEARARIMAAIEGCAALAESYRRGRATTRGLSLVILGQPNAGKSTLLNALVGSDRAIVTPIPGTTRDIVRETIEIGGLPVTIADTAGLRSNADAIEEIGIERARRAAGEAEVVLYLIDSSRGIDAVDQEELARHGEKLIPIYTKKDIGRSPADGLSISASTGDGMRDLLARLDALVRERFAAPEGSPTLVNERQRASVVSAESSLRLALGSLDGGLDEQMVLVDLYVAANALALLTGAISRDDVFEQIFTKFCIGK